jgi:uncharacterized membrane protein YeaQ/YmgE (transglycosylase-associated protein family)
MVRANRLITGSILIIIIGLFGSFILPEIASSILAQQSNQLTQSILFLIMGFMLLVILSMTLSVSGGKQ